ncbi:MAG: fibronectin type III domain-containing protein [Uliginosibacterium sp.]|nr:fibronectin type III domain-containing protein [Uliginosibacterium sp.]
MRSSPVSRLLLALFTSMLISCGGGGGGGESSSTGSSGGTTPSVIDITAPSAPASLRAEGKSATSVSLSWSAASDDQGVTGYQIYRNGALVSAVQGNLLNYIDTGLMPGSSYRYSIKAVDAAGNLSPASAEFLVSTNSQSTPDAQAPSAPASFTLSSVGQTSLSLVWSAASDDVGVVAYQLIRDGNVIASLGGTSQLHQHRPDRRYPLHLQPACDRCQRQSLDACQPHRHHPNDPDQLIQLQQLKLVIQLLLQFEQRPSSSQPLPAPAAQAQAPAPQAPAAPPAPVATSVSPPTPSGSPSRSTKTKPS